MLEDRLQVQRTWQQRAERMQALADWAAQRAATLILLSLSRSLFSVRRIFVSPSAAVPVVSSNAGQFTLCGASSFVGRAHMMRARSVSHGVEFPPLVAVTIPTLLWMDMAFARHFFGRNWWIKLFVLVIVCRAAVSRKAHDAKATNNNARVSFDMCSSKPFNLHWNAHTI